MFKICKHQLKIAFSSPRIYIALFFGSVMQIVSEMPLLEFSKSIGKPLCILEGFIYLNSDTYIVAAAFLGIVIMVSDIPFSSENETYTLLRVSRKKWVGGKILYLFSVCSIYYIWILIVGMIFIRENAYIANFWSEPIYYLTKQIEYGDIPVYFPYSHILLLSPLKAMLASFFLSVGYGFIMSLFLFLFNIKLSRSFGYLGAMVIHVIGYVLTVLFLTLDVVKYSLFGNSLLMYHVIGNQYEELFMTLSESFLIYIVSAVIVSLLIFKAVKKYDFRITVGTRQ